ncbi:MAG: zf-TFIIB domain-containing protein [Planctomycetota bacterium]|jgi:Zn-finger nucleic acid-binding protein
MYCPNCRTLELIQATVKEGGGVIVEYCAQCKGFWLDKGEIEKVCKVAIKDLSIPSKAKKVLRICPHCSRLMYTFDYPQTIVTIEICKTCEGLWIDAGELKEIEKVRKNLKEQGRLKEYDDVGGFKGALIKFVDNTINYLQSR